LAPSFSQNPKFPVNTTTKTLERRHKHINLGVFTYFHSKSACHHDHRRRKGRNSWDNAGNLGDLMSTSYNPPIALLWKELAKRGLKTTGTKQELIKRLQEADDGGRHGPTSPSHAPSDGVQGSFVPVSEDPQPEQDWIRIQPNDVEPEMRSTPGKTRKRGRDAASEPVFPGWELLAAPAGHAAGAVHVSRSQYDLQTAGYEYAVSMGAYYGGDARYYGGHTMGYNELPGFVGVHVPPAPVLSRPDISEYYTPSSAPVVAPVLFHPSGRLVWAGPTSFEGFAHRSSVVTATSDDGGSAYNQYQAYLLPTDAEEVSLVVGSCVAVV
jgi:hypothetical protein